MSTGSENMMEGEAGSENMVKSEEELELEIRELKYQLANKEKELQYAKEMNKLRVEVEHLRKLNQELGQQNPRFRGTSASGMVGPEKVECGLQNNISFQAASASGEADSVLQPGTESAIKAEVVDLTKDEVVAAPRVQPSGSAPTEVEGSLVTLVREYWNTLTDEQKQAAIQLHDDRNSSIPVYVCDIQKNRVVDFSLEFSATYLRSKISKLTDRLGLKAFAANNLKSTADIELLMRSGQHCSLCKGWTGFAKSNGIKFGDICAFQFSDDVLSVTVQVIKAAKREDMVETAAGAAATQTGMAVRGGGSGMTRIDQSFEEPSVAERTRGRAAVCRPWE
ncbi:hypothetical protein ACP4OV_022323 [Aristida adscensionis]